MADLARHAHMSVRTFTRKFRAEVGQSPQQWITRQRVDRARRLLETTDLTINEIATAVGFADPVQLRTHLRAAIGLSPHAYRRAYSVTRWSDGETAVPGAKTS